MNKTLLNIFSLFFLWFFNVPFSQAQCPIGNNNGFENPVPGIKPGGMSFVDQNTIDGWRTTASDGIIEIWSSGFYGVPAYEGNQFAELNAHRTSTLIKYFNAVAGRKITLSFAHRGREGIDQMRVSIVPQGGAIQYLINPLTGTEIFSDGKNAWRKYEVQYIPPTTGPYEMRFEAFRTATGDNSVGNFLDAVSPIADPIIVRLNPTIVNCDENKVRIDGTGSTEAPFISYKWMKDGVEIPRVNNLGVTFITDKIIEVTQEGVYTMMGTDMDYGCTGSDAYVLKRFRPQIKITYPPISGSCNPDVNPAPVLPVVETESNVQLSQLGFFSCDQPGLFIDPKTGAVDIARSKAGIYQVKFTVPSANFCGEINIDEIKVDINTPFDTFIKAGVLGNCDGASTILSAETDVNQQYTYQWFLDGVNLNHTQKELTATKEGNYRVIVTNELGCAKAAEHILKKQSLVDFKLDKTEICLGESITIQQITQNHITNWEWETSDGFKKTGGEEFNYTFTQAGNQWIKLIVTSDLTNCKEEKMILVTVHALPSKPSIQSGILGDCAGSSTSLTAITDGGKYTYSWYFNGNLLPETSPQIQVSQEGSYQVAIQNENGCAEMSDPFLVQKTALIQLSLNANEICLGNAVVVTASENTAIKTWTWETSDGTIINGNSVLNYVFKTAGKHWVKLKVTSDVTNCTEEKMIAVEVVPLPPIPVIKAGVLGDCIGASTILTAQTDGKNYTYAWFFNGKLLPDVSPNIRVSEEGNYQLVIQSPLGCTAQSALFELKKTSLFQLNVNTTQVCFGDAITATGSSKYAIQTWTWETSDGHKEVGNEVFNYVFKKAGAQWIKLTVTSNETNCAEEKIIPVTIFALPSKPSIQSGILGDCVGSTTTLTAITDGGKYSYAWYFNGKLMTETAPKIQVSQEGSYQVAVQNENGCTEMSDQFSVQKTALIQLSLSTNQVCLGNAVVVTAAANTAVKTWTWETSEGTVINGNSVLNYVFKTAGKHWVKLKVTSDLTNCTEEKMITVEVLPLPLQPKIFAGILGECAGSSTTLTAQTEDNGTFTYAWFKEGKSLNLNSKTITVTQAGNYEVLISTLAGCGVKASIDLKVLPSPNLKIENNVHCEGGRITAVYDKNSTFQLTWFRKQDKDWVKLDENNDVLVVNEAGIYRVVLQNEAQCTYSAETKITIKPDADFTYSASRICLGQKINIQPKNNVSIERWVWEMSDGTTFETSKPFDFEFKTVGKHWIKVIGFTQGNVCFDEKIIRVEVIPVPKAIFDFERSEKITIGASVTVNNRSTIEGNQWANVKSLWDFGDGTVSSEFNPQAHVYQKSGIYEVKLTLVNELGCSTTTTQKINIYGFPKANFVFGKPNYCIDEHVAITNTSTTDFNPIVKMEWFYDFGVNTQMDKTENSDAGIGQTQLLKYPYEITSNRKVWVKLVVHAFTGHTDSIMQMVTLFPKPNLVLEPVDALCINSPSVQLKVKELNGLKGVGKFSGAGVSPDGIFKPSLAHLGANVINYTFVPADGCPSTVSQFVYVEPLPMAFMPDKIIVFEKENYQIKPDYRGKIKSYHWLDMDGNELFNEPYPTVNLDHDVDLKLVLESEAGCVSERVVKIIAYKEIIVFGAFSPNNDGVNDTWEIPNLKKYGSMANLKIYNRNGQLVFQCEGYDHPWTGSMSGEPLPLGTYFYVITKSLGKKIFTGSVTIIK